MSDPNETPNMFFNNVNEEINQDVNISDHLEQIENLYREMSPNLWTIGKTFNHTGHGIWVIDRHHLTQPSLDQTKTNQIKYVIRDAELKDNEVIWSMAETHYLTQYQFNIDSPTSYEQSPFTLIPIHACRAVARDVSGSVTAVPINMILPNKNQTITPIGLSELKKIIDNDDFFDNKNAEHTKHHALPHLYFAINAYQKHTDYHNPCQWMIAFPGLIRQCLQIIINGEGLFPFSHSLIREETRALALDIQKREEKKDIPYESYTLVFQHFNDSMIYALGQILTHQDHFVSYQQKANIIQKALKNTDLSDLLQDNKLQPISNIVGNRQFFSKNHYSKEQKEHIFKVMADRVKRSGRWSKKLGTPTGTYIGLISSDILFNTWVENLSHGLSLAQEQIHSINQRNAALLSPQQVIDFRSSKDADNEQDIPYKMPAKRGRSIKSPPA